MSIKFVDEEIIRVIKKRAKKIFYSIFIDHDTVNNFLLVYWLQWTTFF